jgi:hypothetical protein
MPPQISLFELYNIKKKKDSIKNVSFDKILEKCHTKIKNVAQTGGMNIFFEIPYIVIGLPLYNINDCIEYITKSLRKNGFLTQNLPPPNTNYLYISWKIEDVNVNKKKLLLT